MHEIKRRHVGCAQPSHKGRIKARQNSAPPDEQGIFSKFCRNTSQAYDIVLLTETHIGKDVNIVLPGYNYFPVCRPKSANNRYFGGLGIFVKNTILPGIEILKNTSLDYQWVKLDKKFFNFAKHIFLCLAYIIPASSSYIFQSDNDPLETTEKDIINYYAERGHIVICGDLNARTGSELDFIENDTYDPFAMDDEEYEYDIGLQKRKSCGKFKWTDCSKEKFQDALCHPSCKLDINAFLTNNYQDKSNINSAATDLQNIIIKAKCHSNSNLINIKRKLLIRNNGMIKIFTIKREN
ncbi:unnamed protein product [Mytilus coruscus]|uniref:Endonuclease/exonuclease/phosphatase domain-containing protein n=1 Tax=Mytilus coruscus TaxID=42192 RepID=A0A6J8BNC2_MYTCO|nr:unnamed protein product [Mytilus coruscus]